MLVFDECLITMVPGTPHHSTLKPKLPKIGELGRMLLGCVTELTTKIDQGGGYRKRPTESIGIVRMA
ncbi:MAG: hypothetical protein QOI14_1770 [Actinomycetota bacterium]|nr:hypothetical protein [Actinomycetota bacterium]